MTSKHEEQRPIAEEVALRLAWDMYTEGRVYAQIHGDSGMSREDIAKLSAHAERQLRYFTNQVAAERGVSYAEPQEVAGQVTSEEEATNDE